jgi:hypothetical protein
LSTVKSKALKNSREKSTQPAPAPAPASSAQIVTASAPAADSPAQSQKPKWSSEGGTKGQTGEKEQSETEEQKGIPKSDVSESVVSSASAAPSTPTRANELLSSALKRMEPPTPVTPNDLITNTLMDALFDDDDIGLDDESIGGDSLYGRGDSLYGDDDFNSDEDDLDDDVQFEKRFRTASLAAILAKPKKGGQAGGEAE